MVAQAGLGRPGRRDAFPAECLHAQETLLLEHGEQLGPGELHARHTVGERLHAEQSISDIELVRYELLWGKVLEMLK